MAMWMCDPDQLYMVMEEDNSLTSGAFFFHFLAYNVPGCDIASGDVRDRGTR